MMVALRGSRFFAPVATGR